FNAENIAALWQVRVILVQITPPRGPVPVETFQSHVVFGARLIIEKRSRELEMQTVIAIGQRRRGRRLGRGAPKNGIIVFQCDYTPDQGWRLYSIVLGYGGSVRNYGFGGGRPKHA